MLKHVQNVMLTKIDEVIAKHFLIFKYKVPVLFHKALNYHDPFYLKQAKMCKMTFNTNAKTRSERNVN